VQVVTTVPSQRIGRRIARALVDGRLAACVQTFGPIASTYRWQGRVETAREWLCFIKTTRLRLRQAISTVEALHPYDTPEIIAVPITAGSSRYLEWIAASTRPAPAKPGTARRPGCR
jgi:periplasmic divalent cation tolerance protein